MWTYIDNAIDYLVSKGRNRETFQFNNETQLKIFIREEFEQLLSQYETTDNLREKELLLLEMIDFSEGSGSDSRPLCEKLDGVRKQLYDGQVINYGAHTREKDRVAAGVLAIFLGGIGIHKFYLGKVRAGILYLVFCWTFVPAILGIVDGIVILAGNNETFNRKYNNGQ